MLAFPRGNLTPMAVATRSHDTQLAPSPFHTCLAFTPLLALRQQGIHTAAHTLITRSSSILPSHPPSHRRRHETRFLSSGSQRSPACEPWWQPSSQSAIPLPSCSLLAPRPWPSVRPATPRCQPRRHDTVASRSAPHVRCCHHHVPRPQELLDLGQSAPKLPPSSASLSPHAISLVRAPPVPSRSLYSNLFSSFFSPMPSSTPRSPRNT